MINDITQLLTFLPYYNTTLVVNTFSVTIAIRADGPTNVDHGQSFNDCLMIMLLPLLARMTRFFGDVENYIILEMAFVNF